MTVPETKIGWPASDEATASLISVGSHRILLYQPKCLVALFGPYPLRHTNCGALPGLLVVLIPPIPQQQIHQNNPFQRHSRQSSIGHPCSLSSEIPSSKQRSYIHPTLPHLLGYLYALLISTHHDYPRREDVLAPSPAIRTPRSSQPPSIPILSFSYPGLSHDRSATHLTQDRLRDVHAERFD